MFKQRVHPRFTPDLVSDAKRVVRSEHWLFADSLLAARQKPIVVIVPGQAAREEITSIRAVMPSAYIVAIDRDAEAVRAAEEAGADETHHADLSTIQTIAGDRKFDAIRLDLCGQATPNMANLVSLARQTLSSNGVMMACFSYSRDPGLIFKGISGHVKRLVPQCSDRVMSLLRYRGHKVPMCEVLWVGESDAVHELPSPMWVKDSDLGLTVTRAEDIDSLAVDTTPAARIKAWRAMPNPQKILPRQRHGDATDGGEHRVFKKLYGYQAVAVKKLVPLLRSKRSVLAVSPTGSGKTIVGVATILKMGKKTRVLWIAHRQELLHQAVDQVEEQIAKILATGGVARAEVGLLSGCRKENLSARILVSGIGSVVNRLKTLDTFDLIVVDEANRNEASSYKKVRTAFPDAMILGLTATPQRLDGKALGESFDVM